MPLRDATERDAEACAAIYAPYVSDTALTFEEERAAYRWTCEVSVHLEVGRRRGGSGRQLYEALFGRLAERGSRTLVAVMTLPDDAGEGLHRALGFEPVGTLRRVGWKHGPWRDVAWAQGIGPDDGPPADLG